MLALTAGMGGDGLSLPHDLHCLGVPAGLTADRGYDSDPHRKQLKARRIEPEIAGRRTEHGSGLGVIRYVVE